jgi:hypothetical protein
LESQGHLRGLVLTTTHFEAQSKNKPA